MNEAAGTIDRRTARRRFERAARTYAGASRVEAEVGARMLVRLDYVRIAPRRVLDAGCGPAREARSLAERYRAAAVIALDFSLGMLREARRRPGMLARIMGSRPLHAICADMERLPLASGSVGLLWSNMALHWLDEPVGALKEFARVLEPGGLLMFSTLGPDSLKELRLRAGPARVHRFHDMHDIGDRLVAAGFAAPVMDMEMLTLQYAGTGALLQDLRRSGQTNALAGRPRGLAGRELRKQLADGGDPPGGGFPVSWEIVYGHAWKRDAAPAQRPQAPAALRFVRSRGT